MKKFVLLFAILFGSLMPSGASAQVNINVNIGSQPLWGPVGYERVDYYYLPDIESYYYVPRRQFIYISNNNWVFASAPPARYRNYNLYNGYKVVINSPRPYRYFSDHRVKYAKYKGHKGQPAIRYSKNPKYKRSHGHAQKAAPGNHQRSKYKGNRGKSHGKGRH